MLWEEIQNLSKNRVETTQQTFQEHMQKTILTYLSQRTAFNQIVFQGGTALRIFYNNPRFSEDLDFVLKNPKEKYDLSKNTQSIKRYIESVYPFLEEIKTKSQKTNAKIQRTIIKTISEKPEQKIQIHIELAQIPSYHNQPKILFFPPFNPAVTVEKPLEILADKITALGLRDYIKGRDLWDIYHLTVEQQIKIDYKLVNQKIKDYEYTEEQYLKKLQNTKELLKTNGKNILENEMKRFLPKTLLDQYHAQFDKIIQHIIKITKESLEKK